MKDFTTFFLVLIVITILYLYLETKALKVTYVESMIDNKKYLVRDLPDKQNAADLLAQIKNKLSNLTTHLDNNKEKEEFNGRKDGIERLNKNFKPDNISESSPGNSYTSYSINKGEKIVFCIRAKRQSNKLMDINTMMFVAIHELAHLMSKSIGHTSEFWDNMKFLLEIAVQLGIYKKQDFNNNPVDYCGMKITDTPLNE